MGYKPGAKRYRLDFEGTPYEGLEVETRSTSLETVFTISKLSEGFSPGQTFTIEDINVFRELLTQFAAVIARWNMEEEDDTPIPITAESLMNQDMGLVMFLIDAWITAMLDVPAGLKATLPGGEKPPEVSIPVVPLSPSQAS